MWDPNTYLAFADHRGRPFADLLGRVGADAPREVIDLGCGPGNLTASLPSRWPDATVRGIDSSAEMVAAARERGVSATVGDVRTWSPGTETDVVVTNAVLQWLPEHPELIVRWAGEMTAGSWFAMQVPGNFDAPSHMLLRELVRESRWNDRLESVFLREDAVLDPAGYADLLADAGCAVDAWETTYLHPLTGEDPVLDWVSGTALRPIKAALADADWTSFRADLAPRLRAAYPARADGTTWFPFRRILVVARIGAVSG